MGIIYGPVPSWRLGRSLGVDAVSTGGKTCSFDCIYCQLGRTKHPMTERRGFVDARELSAELTTLEVAPPSFPPLRGGDVALDYVTFSGVAEPTLASNLRELVAVVREALPDHPIAILTNASLMAQEEVRRDLALFNVVVAKVDAPDEALFREINRPFVIYTLAEILDGIRRFREGFEGKLALQMMFVEANRDHASRMAKIARELSPDEVQLNTPLRPCPVSPLDPEQMEEIEAEFAGLNTLNVYKAERPEAIALDQSETRRRRPKESRNSK